MAVFIKEGDPVRVCVPNAPVMVVASARENGDVLCHWFGADGTFHDKVFRAAALELVPPEPAPSPHEPVRTAPGPKVTK